MRIREAQGADEVTDKLAEIDADFATVNQNAATATIPTEYIRWLIAEVKRLRWFEENVDPWGGGQIGCRHCSANREPHSDNCEYAKHKEPTK